MKTFAYVAAFLLLGGPAAYAHTELSASMPADKAALDAAPKEVMLHFTEAVRLTALSLTKQGAAAAELGPLPAGKSQHFAVPARELSAGAYTVEWRALSDDGHALRGAFGFTVGTGSSGAAQQSPHAGGSDHAQHSEHSQPH